MAVVRQYKPIARDERKRSAMYLYLLDRYGREGIEMLDRVLKLWETYLYVPAAVKEGAVSYNVVYSLLGVDRWKGKDFEKLLDDEELFYLDFSGYNEQDPHTRVFIVPRWDNLKGYAERSLSWVRAEAGRKGGRNRSVRLVANNRLSD